MRLTDILSGGQLNNQTTVQMDSRPEGGSTASVSRQIQTLIPGQTFQGEVVSRNGNQVQIKVADDFYLEAKVDQSLNLPVGKTMTFEVRNNGQMLTLSPLFANTATQENALKALEMASLPINQNTISMTGFMMEAGLSIDRNSLQQMFREINSFPEAKVSDVVDLHRIGLAVNEENLTQISSYKNLTHQLVEGMHTVLQSLPDSLESMVAEGKPEEAARIFLDLLNMIQELPETETGALTLPGGAPVQGEETAGTGVPVSEQTSGLNGEGQNAPGMTVAVDSEPLVALIDQESQVQGGVEQTEPQQDPAGQVPLLQGSGKEQNDNSLEPILQQFSRAVQNGSLMEQSKVLQKIFEKGLQNKSQTLLEGLLVNKGAQRILSDGLARLWTIEPKDVADADKVSELYARLNRQLSHLSQSLEENGQNQSAAFKAVSNMTQNLDFLQQINQAYTYVQLPLRLQQGDAHGDLYVYTNKRNLASKDGQISALLHLDMEHLGPVDVYVSMHAERVNTKFYVQDDAMLDFLEAHMDILTERLQKRGYHCDFAMQVRGEQTTPESGLKGLLGEEMAKPIAQYAFDVRA